MKQKFLCKQMKIPLLSKIDIFVVLTQCASKKDHLRNMKIAKFQNLFRKAWGCWFLAILHFKKITQKIQFWPLSCIWMVNWGPKSPWMKNQPTYVNPVGEKALSVDIFLSYYLRKIMGWPVQPSPKFLGWKWSYQLLQASLKQFSVVLVHFLILNSHLKISQKQVYGKSLFSNWVNICRLIFLSWTLETPIDHPIKKSFLKCKIAKIAKNNT